MRLKTQLGVAHEVRENIGFRTIELRAGDGLYLNGTKLLLKGVNRHSFWPNTGRALNEALSLYDVRLMKRMNVNAIRSSHYPPDRHFLDACDREGLYVLDELAGWQAAYKADTAARLVEEMVTHDVNHPSILLWDNGNEYGWNVAVDDDFALYDPSHRPVIHPGGKFGEVDSTHYPSYASVTSELSKSTVRLITEFSHAMYDQGGGASLEDYWAQVRKSPVGAGGFIWAMLDEGINRTDTGIIDTRGNNAPDGILGPYRQKEGSYDAVREIWTPVYFVSQPLTATFDGKLVVENRYQFRSLDDVKIDWQLLTTSFVTSTTTVLAEATRSIAGVTPGTRGTVELGLPTDWAQADILVVEALDAEGNVISRISTMPRTAAQASSALVKTDSSSNAAITSTDGAADLVVEAAGTKFTWTKATGLLSSVSHAGKTISFGNGPVLVTKEMSTLTSFTATTEGTDVVVVATYTGGMQNVTWRIHGNGWLSLDYQFALNGSYDYYGIGFDYPEDRVKGAAWLGRGPSRVWKNRMQGPWHGVWQRSSNDAITGQVWDYPEFKGYYDDVAWLRLDTSELPIHFVFASNSLAFGLLVPKDVAAPLDGPIVYPTKSISFLNGIAPIGTFTLTPAELGPQSAKHVLDGTYGGSVFIYFGETTEVPVR
ncbi:MAG: glycoside hydrolase family 2 TIM barrel-domain containing protein [Polyangiaceae bacterium]